jgi:hypothetical protein
MWFKGENVIQQIMSFISSHKMKKMYQYQLNMGFFFYICGSLVQLWTFYLYCIACGILSNTEPFESSRPCMQIPAIQ